MLDDDGQNCLDARLRELLEMIDRRPHFNELQEVVRKIILENEDDDLPDVYRRKLIRHGWEDFWHKHQSVAWAWFFDPARPGQLNQKSADAMKATFEAMVRLLMEGETTYLQSSIAAELRHEIAVYLSLRGDEVAVTPVRIEGSDGASKTTVPVEPEALSIMKDLQRHFPVLRFTADIAESTNISRKTIGNRLSALINHGLAVRPKGSRKGATITPEGNELLKRLDPQVNH